MTSQPTASTEHKRQVYSSRTIEFAQIDPFEWQATLNQTTATIAPLTLPAASTSGHAASIEAAYTTKACATTQLSPPAVFPFPTELSNLTNNFATFRERAMPRLIATIDSALQSNADATPDPNASELNFPAPVSFSSAAIAEQCQLTGSMHGVDVHDVLDFIALEASTLDSHANDQGVDPADKQNEKTLVGDIAKYNGVFQGVWESPKYSIPVEVPCHGLNGSGQLNKITVSLTYQDPLQSASSPIVKEVDLTCAPTVALVAGVVFSGLGNYTYSANAGPVAPGASPPPTSVITQNPPGHRPLIGSPAAYLHIALPVCTKCNDVGLDATLVGAPVLGSSANSSAPFLEGGGGISLSLWDSLFFTTGAFYTSKTIPQPGFEVGKTVATGTTIPTRAIPQWTIFLGVSGKIP